MSIDASLEKIIVKKPVSHTFSWDHLHTLDDTPIKITDLEKELEELKRNNATHIQINAAHDETTYITGWEIREETDVEYQIRQQEVQAIKQRVIDSELHHLAYLKLKYEQ